LDLIWIRLQRFIEVNALLSWNEIDEAYKAQKLGNIKQEQTGGGTTGFPRGKVSDAKRGFRKGLTEACSKGIKAGITFIWNI